MKISCLHIDPTRVKTLPKVSPERALLPVDSIPPVWGLLRTQRLSGFICPRSSTHHQGSFVPIERRRGRCFQTHKIDRVAASLGRWNGPRAPSSCARLRPELSTPACNDRTPETRVTATTAEAAVAGYGGPLRCDRTAEKLRLDGVDRQHAERDVPSSHGGSEVHVIRLHIRIQITWLSRYFGKFGMFTV